MFCDPEPKGDQTNQDLTENDFNDFEEAHSEWKRRQVKPEFKGWKSFKEEMPKIKTKLYVIHRSDLDAGKHPHQLSSLGEFDNWVRTNEDVSYEDEDWIWIYAISYDEEFQCYESNRLRWKGFEDVSSVKMENAIFLWNRDLNMMIRFKENRIQVSHPWFVIEGSYVFVEELVSGCKIRGIKLEEI